MPESETVSIRLIDDGASMAEALSFINAIAFQRHRSAPPPPPDLLFGAYLGRSIIGTISIDWNLPLLSHWDLRDSILNKDKFVQYGRWTSTMRGISVALFYAANVFTLSYGKEHVLCEAKPRIVNRLSGLGFMINKMDGAVLRTDKIPSGGLPYYINDPPSVFTMDIRQIQKAAVRNMRPLNFLEFNLK